MTDPLAYEVTQERDPWTKMPVWLPRQASPTAVAVYAELASYAWMRDGARPALASVADALKMSDSTIRRAVKDLEKVGAVVVEHRWVDPEKRQKLPSRYHLKVHHPIREGGVTGDTPPVTHDRTPPVTHDRTLRSPVTDEVDKREVDKRKVGGEGGVSHDNAPAESPSPQCKSHIDNPNPPPCGACADARRNHAKWEDAERQTRAADQSGFAREAARIRRAQIDACQLCDNDGYTTGRVCHHDPDLAGAAERGMAAVMEALNQKKEVG